MVDKRPASIRSVTEITIKHTAELHPVSGFPESFSAQKGISIFHNLTDPIYEARYLNKRELKSTQTWEESK